MSTAEFQVIYDGPALQSSAMNARELSASLAAIDDLFSCADRKLNHGKTRQTLKVQGSFETGSFKINFQSSRSTWDKIEDILTLPEVSTFVAAHDLLNIVLFGSLGLAGLIRLTRFLKGKQPTKIYENKDGTLKVYRGEKYLKAEKKVLELYNDHKTRIALEKTVVTPLEEGKIDEIAFNQIGDPRFEIITVSEKDYFIAPDLEREDVNQMQYTAYISLVRVSFREGNKWTVYDGANQISVTVEDQSFLDGVEKSRVSFTKGDKLKVEMRAEQFAVDTALRTEYYIVKVLEHNHPEFKGQGDLL